MTSLGLSRYALAIGAASILLAGCGGSQPPIGAPGSVPQSRAIAEHADRARSWMLPEAKRDDLIYVASEQASYVLSYPAGKLVGTINSFANADCTDRSGNVFLLEGSTIAEYAHGSTTPIETLNTYPRAGFSCSVDKATGNLAVGMGGGSGPDVVAVYRGAEGTPTIYTPDFSNPYCGYDDQGNLFLDGQGAGDAVRLAELPKGGSALENIGLNGYIHAFPQQPQWDGTYMTIESVFLPHVFIYRLQLAGSVASVVGETTFMAKMKQPGTSWIQGNTIMIPYGPPKPNFGKIGFWRYPGGGKSYQTVKAKKLGLDVWPFNGVTVSRARH